MLPARRLRGEGALRLDVAAWISREELFPEQGPVLVAVSGGPDSTALLAVLAGLAGHRGVVPVAVYVDHGLRADTELDWRAVTASAARVGTACLRVEAAVGSGPGLEARARVARYAALERATNEQGAVAIATGHTADENVETVLLNLLRGAGLDGLAGIPPRRGRVVRPLLRVWKAEAIELCAVSGLPVRFDPMNADLRFARVQVRTRVLPLLERANPAVREVLARQAELLRDDAAFLEAQVPAGAFACENGGVRFTAAVLAHAEPAIARRIVRAGLRALTGRQWGSAADVDAVLGVARSGGRTGLMAGLAARRRAGDVVVFRARGRPAPSLTSPPTRREASA